MDKFLNAKHFKKITILLVALFFVTLTYVHIFANSTADEDTNQYKKLTLDTFLYLKEGSQVDSYIDLPDSPYWAEDAIYYFKALGIFSSETDYFYPNNYVTYYEFSNIMQKLLGLDTNNLQEYNLLQDLKDKSGYLKREEVAYILANAIELYSVSTNIYYTREVKEDISDYAKDKVLFAIQKGILKGDNNGNFDKYVTRAELAVMLYNFISLYFA